MAGPPLLSADPLEYLMTEARMCHMITTTAVVRAAVSATSSDACKDVQVIR